MMAYCCEYSAVREPVWPQGFPTDEGSPTHRLHQQTHSPPTNKHTPHQPTKCARPLVSPAFNLTGKHISLFLLFLFFLILAFHLKVRMTKYTVINTRWAQSAANVRGGRQLHDARPRQNPASMKWREAFDMLTIFNHIIFSLKWPFGLFPLR